MNKECYEKLSQSDRIEYMLDIGGVTFPAISISLGLTSVMLLLGIYVQLLGEFELARETIYRGIGLGTGAFFAISILNMISVYIYDRKFMKKLTIKVGENKNE